MANGSPFTLDMSSPFRAGWTGGLGGPNQGGHGGGEWYIRFGMDLGVKAGTEVFAAFDCYVHRFNPHTPANDTAKVYGAQLFVRCFHDESDKDKLSGFYTHITCDRVFSQGQAIKRGDLLGKTLRDHLHLALVENFPGGSDRGVAELYQKFLAVRDTPGIFSVAFKQDGSPPVVS